MRIGKATITGPSDVFHEIYLEKLRDILMHYS
jgi:hypothetical protein